MSDEGGTDVPDRPDGPPDGSDASPPPPPRRRRWLRLLLLALGVVVALVLAGALWIALDPGLVRPLAERIATAATGRPVTIGTLDLQFREGRTIIEARNVQVGLTTTERVTLSFSAGRSHANGGGVRFPNGSSIDQFSATIVLSPLGRPKIATVDATGAVLVATRRARADPGGPPPFARLLVVPRVLLGLGMERLVLHSGTIEYRGLSTQQSAGMSAIIEANGHEVSVRGTLEIAPELPSLPFEGTVRDPMSEDWQIDVRLTGERVPMEVVRFLAGVLEPGPTVRRTLDSVSSTAEFVLDVQLVQTQFEAVVLDFTFGPPEAPEGAGINLDGIGFQARGVPEPPGWTVAGEVDWSGLPEGAHAIRSPFVVRWTTGVPGSLQWSARTIAIPLLARVAENALAPGDALRSLLERSRPVGMIDEVAASGDPDPGDDPDSSGSPSFWLSAAVSGFGATAGQWQVSGAGARIVFTGADLWLRFMDDRLSVSVPSFRSSPYDLNLRGEVRLATDGPGWALETEGLDVSTSGVSGRIRGGLDIPDPDESDTPVLDAELRLNDAALTDLGTLLPDRRAAAFGEWYRRAVRSGRLAGATARVQGDPRRIPFPDGDGTLEVRGSIRAAVLSYARAWPSVRVDEATVHADGTQLAFSKMRGSIFATSIDSGRARIQDMTNPAGRAQISLTGTGPAGDLLAFLRESPLAAPTGESAAAVVAEGPASTTVDLDVPYGRDSADRPLDATGTIELDGVAIRLAGRPATLEDVRGEIAFNANTASGGPLTGRFLGADIESHLIFDRADGLRVRFTGENESEWFGLALADLVDLDEAQSDPWLSKLSGRIPWNATYFSRLGIVFRSDLHNVTVDFPAPFGKRADTARPLEIVLTPGAREWMIDASYDPDTRGIFEITEAHGSWSLSRGEVTLGGTRPALPAERRVEVAGTLSEIDLNPWLALATAAPDRNAGWLSQVGRVSIETEAARVAGRSVALRRIDIERPDDGSGVLVHLDGKGAAGEIWMPADRATGKAHVHLERLHLGERFPRDDHEGDDVPAEADRARKTGRTQPGDWPSFDVRIKSLRFGDIDLGTVLISGDRTESGLEIEKLRADSRNLRMDGRGSWRSNEDGISTTRFEARIDTDDLADLLSATGLAEEAVAGGTIALELDLAWPGGPLTPTLERLEGRIEMAARDGHLPRVRVGPVGRLLALLSLEALPRVLALDLSHVVGKGFVYDRITAHTILEGGTAKIHELVISGPSARIEVSGSVDLAARHYDQEVAVIPRLTRSGALLPAWTAAWPVLVGNFFLEKVAGDKILLDRLFRLRYRLNGPWDDPVIERIKLSGRTKKQ